LLLLSLTALLLFVSALSAKPPPPSPATSSTPTSSTTASTNHRPGLPRSRGASHCLHAPPRTVVRSSKPAARHLQPWNHPADVTVSTACALNFSLSHEPGATTTGRRSPRRSPPTAHPPPWSTFYVEFFPAPTPKSGSFPRRPPPRPVSPASTPPVHRNRPEPPPPRAMVAPPLLRQWAASYGDHRPTRMG
jgi:hypothetical protein